MTNWISVINELPTEDGEYLSWDGMDYYCEKYFSKIQRWDLQLSDPPITHWMPLPEPPKKE